MRFLNVLLGLACALLALPALSEISPFSEDLKTGQVFSFSQKDHFFTEYTGKEVVYNLDYTKWLPKKSNGQVILYNHGLQSHRGWFNNTGERLKEMGYIVYAFDRVGSGTSSAPYGIDGYPLGLEEFLPFRTTSTVVQKRGHIHDYRFHLKSLDLILNIIKNEHPDLPINLWANSYGSKIITRFLLDKDRANLINSTVFTTPGLFRNKETMPLPFSKLELILGKNIDEFPSPVTNENNDNGASWFTDLEPWVSKIKQDPLSVRYMTRKLALETRKMDNYISNHIENNDAISSVPRYYLLVKGDPMMDNQLVEEHINRITKNSVLKYYEGGKNHKHFLAFTSDAPQVLKDIHHFFTQHGQPRIAGQSI